MNIIDLSHKINEETPAYPGDDKISLHKAKTLENDFYTSYILKSGMHTGTHVDLPMHLTKCNKTVDLYNIGRFVGKGVFLNYAGMKSIYYDTKYDGLINENDIIVVYTGHSEYYSQPSIYFYEYPVITKNFALELIRKRVSAIALDTPSPDFPPFEVHKLLLENNIFIFENLTNLEKLQNIKCFTFHGVPLKIQAEASLIRAYAIVGN